jgi:hypothetical protein
MDNHVKILKISSPRVCGTIKVDERNIIQDTPSNWNKYKNRHFDCLLGEIDPKGNVEIHYRLTGEHYGNSKISAGTKYIKRPAGTKEGDRRSQIKPSQIGRKGGTTPEPIKEGPRIIFHRGSIQEGLGFGSYTDDPGK